MTIYSIDLKVAATAYVRANSKQEAIKALMDKISDFYTDVSDFEISGLPFDDPDLPAISLSPAMTVIGPFGPWSDMELAE